MQRNTNTQLGGTFLGMVLGILMGLGIALAVAMYVMKVPTPFNSKSTMRTSAQDAAEAKKNKDWDPNAALPGHKAPDKTQATAASADQTEPTSAAAGAQAASDGFKPATGVAPTNAAGTGAESLPGYYVQAGAFRNSNDAQNLRGKLALANFESKVFEHNQTGQTVYRVRVGPMASLALAEKTKAQLEGAGFEASVIRPQN